MIDPIAEQIVGVYAGLNHSTGRLGKLIVYVQDPGKVLRKLGIKIPTHARLGFVLRDGSRFYFEALEGDGYKGPKPESRAQSWAAEDPFRWTNMIDLPCTVEQSQDAYYRAKNAIGRYRYSIWQLVLMYLNQRFHLPLPRTPNKVVCSEAVAHILWPDLDLRKDRSFDAVTPLWIQHRCSILVNETTL